MMTRDIKQSRFSQSCQTINSTYRVMIKQKKNGEKRGEREETVLHFCAAQPRSRVCVCVCVCVGPFARQPW